MIEENDKLIYTDWNRAELEYDPWQDELTEAEYYEMMGYAPCGCSVCMCGVWTQYGVACADCASGAHQG